MRCSENNSPPRRARTADQISVIVLSAALLGVATAGLESHAASGRSLVKEGLRKYRSGDYAAAAKAFEQAQTELPDNPRVAFDRACVLAAQDKLDEAVELFQTASSAREAKIASESHFNLGCIATTKAKKTFGETPAEASPQQRQEGLDQLRQAVIRYRRCLEVNPAHEKARHNIELVRLWIKHMQDVWERRDRERLREEMDTLQFLGMIQQRQRALRQATRVIQNQADSPRRRQAVSQMANSQQELSEELPVLMEKIAATVNAAMASESDQDDSQQVNQEAVQRAVAGLTKLVEATQQLMSDAAASLTSSNPETSVEPQTGALDELNQLYIALAPFGDMLQRAIQRQQELVTGSEMIQSQQQDATSQGEELASPDFDELSRVQGRIDQWAAVLPDKASMQLAQMSAIEENEEAERQKISVDSADEPAENDEEREKPPPTSDSQENQEAIANALRKAIEMAPEVEQLAAEATDLLEQEDVQAAQPKQQRALEILREIAKELEQQQDQQEQQENQEQQEQDEKDDKEQGEDQNEGDQNGQNKEDQQAQQDQQQQEQPSNEDKNDKQKQQQQQMSQQESEAAMSKVRQREREYRDLQKQLRAYLQGAVNVEKDW